MSPKPTSGQRPFESQCAGYNFRFARHPLGVGKSAATFCHLLSARKRSRQVEPWEYAIFKAGHGRDPAAPQGYDV